MHALKHESVISNLVMMIFFFSFFFYLMILTNQRNFCWIFFLYMFFFCVCFVIYRLQVAGNYLVFRDWFHSLMGSWCPSHQNTKLNFVSLIFTEFNFSPIGGRGEILQIKQRRSIRQTCQGSRNFSDFRHSLHGLLDLECKNHQQS